MKDVEGMGGTVPSPENREIYRKEFLQGLDLFKRALDQYQVTEEAHKKDSFKKVMDEALHVLNETANTVCQRKSQATKEESLENDYNTFIRDSSTENFQKLQSDIKSLKKSIS